MKLKKIVVASVVACLLAVAAAVPASAASMTRLNTNQTYRSYDVTGDGKKDTIKIVSKDSRYMDWDIYVNGKRRLSEEGKGGEMYIFTSKGKNVMIFRRVYMGSASDFSQIIYTNGTFKEKEMYDGKYFGDYGVSGNTLKIYGQDKGPWQTGSFRSLNNIPFKIVNTYKISGNKMKKTDKYASISGQKTFYAKNTFTAGRTPASVNKRDGITVRAGQKVTLKAYYCKKSNHKTYYKLSVNGKTGWFEDSESIQFRK